MSATMPTGDPCARCGYFHSAAQCPTPYGFGYGYPTHPWPAMNPWPNGNALPASIPLNPRLSADDIERIAKRVAELLKAGGQ